MAGVIRAKRTAQNSNWTLKRVTVKVRAEASLTEEPDAGKPHVRDCAGGAGWPTFLPRDVFSYSV
ncbi:MAG TPA: hypothetical protein DCR95_00490 [Desulfobacter sp.]|nr:hypothetical protein [Desulfobacter sp.]